jgi:23S rRNA-intervening sequence protein
MKDFRDFKVWEKAHEFVLEIYRLTSGFPKHNCSV